MPLYRSKRQTLLTVTSQPPAAAVGIKALYQAEGNVLDSINNANGVTVGSLTYDAGIFGKAFSLDGSTAYVQIPYVSALEATTTETLMAWIYLKALPGGGASFHIFGQSTNSNDNDLLIGFSTTNSLQFFGFPNASAVSAPFPFLAYRWYHVAVTVSSVNNARILYINGEIVATSTCSARSNSTNDWSIGESLVFPGRKFNGLIDDVRMYNVALTTAQIAQAMGNAPTGILKPRRSNIISSVKTPITSLKAWIKADGNTADSVGNVFAVWQGTPAYTTGTFGQAFNLSGANYLRFAYTPDVSFTSTMTLMCWFRLASSPGVWTIAAQSASGNDNDLLFNGATLQYYGFGASPLNCTTSFSTLQWYHIAIVVNSPASSKTFYVNGSPAGTGSAAARANSITDWSIGESLVFTGRKFVGQIEDVRLYSTALTQAQIQQIVQSGTPIYGERIVVPQPRISLPTANLLANWRIDSIGANDGALVGTWEDSSGNGWNATQATDANKPIYKANVFNGRPALRFDGTRFLSVGALFGSATAAEIYVLVSLDLDPPTDANLTGLMNFGGSSAERTHFPWTDGTIYDNFCTNSRKTTANPATSLTGWNLYSIRSASGDWRSYLNGIQIYSTVSNTFQSTSTAGNFIGKSLSSTLTSFYLVGYIAEIALYGTTLTTSQQAQVVGYFMSKYALV